MSGAHLAGMVCYFMAIAYLPLAEVIALGFSKPLFVTLGAALVLGEVVRARAGGPSRSVSPGSWSCSAPAPRRSRPTRS